MSFWTPDKEQGIDLSFCGWILSRSSRFSQACVNNTGVVSLETIHDIVDVCEVLYLFFGFTDETAYACFSKDLMLGYDNHIERFQFSQSI